MSSREPIVPVFVVGAVIVGAVFAVVAINNALEEEVYYICATEDGQIVEPDLCDVNGGGYYYFSSPTYIAPGSHAPSGWHTNRFSPRDTQARSSRGLPKTGKVPSRVSTGGFGKGTSSSSGS